MRDEREPRHELVVNAIFATNFKYLWAGYGVSKLQLLHVNLYTNFRNIVHFFFEVQISFLFFLFDLVPVVRGVQFFQKHLHVVSREPREIINLKVDYLGQIPHKLKAVF